MLYYCSKSTIIYICVSSRHEEKFSIQFKLATHFKINLKIPITDEEICDMIFFLIFTIFKVIS